MVKRTKIGLIYSYKKEWVAGSYYILNLIHALDQLNDENKPELIILSYSQKEFETVKNTSYPYLKFHMLYETDFWVSYTLGERILNKISRVFGGNDIIYREQTRKRLNIKLDLLFPAPVNDYFSNIKNRLFWIPDFQEHFLAQFFSEHEIVSRKSITEKMAAAKNSIVFSSNNVLEHFKSLYPNSRSKNYLLPFAVTHIDYSGISIESLVQKYEINKQYFFCANQFWAHKNHIVVLKALKILKEQGIKNLLVVFSGKESDYRNPHFFTDLKNFVTENGIENFVKFLGFIDREDQLQLMNNAICVIQPSLFEGWSTSVEDAKAMNQFVIASGLPVHKEQLQGHNASFFNPANENELAELIKQYIYHPPLKENKTYYQNVKKFGEQFIGIVNEVKKND